VESRVTTGVWLALLWNSVERDREQGECDILLAAGNSETVGERGDYCRGHLNPQMLHAIPQSPIVSIC
jgi:hypothetical protein